MKDRGKAVDTYNNGNCFTTDYYSSSDHRPCKKHPFSSSVGICAYCLKDRLVKLVCSDCGEQRLSSCSCSEISSSYTNNSGSTVEVGSVGRVSFLIENERTETPVSNSKLKLQDKADKVILLERSSSSHVEIKRSHGFWKIGRLFRKKRDKGYERSSVCDGFDEKSDVWVSDIMGVSRSRSLCSFRGGGMLWSEDGGDCMSVSAARSSSVNGGLLLDSGKKSGFSEAEARKSGFDGQKKTDVLESENGLKGIKMVYKLKESDFNAMDDSGFIDLKLDLSSESKTEFSVSGLDSTFTPSLRGVNHMGNDHECGGSFRSLVGDGFFSNGGSCRITVNERGIKKSRKSLKVWRWIFRHHHHSNCGTAKKKDEGHVLKC